MFFVELGSVEVENGMWSRSVEKEGRTLVHMQLNAWFLKHDMHVIAAYSDICVRCKSTYAARCVTWLAYQHMLLKS